MRTSVAYPIVKALQSAAEAAEAAGAQDRFWAMHDALFEGQERLELSTLLQRAVALQ